MVDLKTTYMGLELRNPVIVGSSGLTATVESIKELADAGAGAVVLKSLFEEQILMSIEASMSHLSEAFRYPGAEDHLRYFEKKHALDEYLKLIKDAKQAVDIPVIASVNCMSDGEWTSFAKEIEAAGADGLELNIFILPADPEMSGEEIRARYFSIIKNVRAVTSLPLAVKISSYFDAAAAMMQRLSHTEISGMVLFNRFYNPDIDLDAEQMASGDAYSHPGDFANSLRWIGLMHGNVDCDLCASTGVHDGDTALKMLLAGADAVQMVSAVYTRGAAHVASVITRMQQWMHQHNYTSIAQMKGKLSQANLREGALYERVQFMKHFQQHQ
jgi:dihydroorotate dehydrogenase (fumarate)